MRRVLETDGYKFSMAEAGWPLRAETFYYSHRRGGLHFLPFNAEAMVRALLPTVDDASRAFLNTSGYAMGGGWRAALAAVDQVQVRALPRGSWFFDREPAFTVTGPSAIVSWLEPLVLQLHYRIQVATLALLEPERLAAAVGTVTCAEQRDIVLETLDAVRVPAPAVQIATEGYYAHVRERVSRLVRIVEDPARVFEVGMRAVTCASQHRVALEACRDEGVRATSNVALAAELGLRPVGTMGHEHVMRYGSDAAAFRAMRDRFPGSSSFLLDTYDTLRSGLPAAYALIAEDPSRRDSVRFDSGDIRTQYLIACSMAQSAGITPRFILEDGFTDDRTADFERLRAFTGVAAADQLYGFGGYIVKAPGDPLTRDRVSAVWKLTQTGPRATMKFGDEPGAGKESIPGRPVLFRPFLGEAGYTGPTGVVLQDGEALPHDHGVLLTGQAEVPMSVRFSAAEVRSLAGRGDRPALSSATRALVDAAYAVRDRQILTRT